MGRCSNSMCSIVCSEVVSCCQVTKGLHQGKHNNTGGNRARSPSGGSQWCLFWHKGFAANSSHGCSAAQSALHSRTFRHGCFISEVHEDANVDTSRGWNKACVKGHCVWGNKQRPQNKDKFTAETASNKQMVSLANTQYSIFYSSTLLIPKEIWFRTGMTQTCTNNMPLSHILTTDCLELNWISLLLKGKEDTTQFEKTISWNSGCHYLISV